MQVGIVGKGCIGKCLAHLLKRSTIHSPTFLVKPTTFKSLKYDGIINSNECEVTYYPTQSDSAIQTSNINILPIEYDSQSHPIFDVIVVCTKSFQLIPALNQLHTNNILQNNPIIIFFHNGIIPISNIPNFIQSDNIPLIFGTTVHAATAFANDNVFTVRHTGNGLTWLGYRNPFINDMVNKTVLCDMFDSAFAPTTWFDDLEPHLLYKLTINCCINPLTAIYQIRNDEIMRNERYLSQMRQICSELCDVFRAYFDDIQNKTDNINENSVLTWNKLCNFHQLWDIVNKSLDGVKMNYSSMNRDIYFNRQSEIDQINGYVVELGKKYNVNVQFNEEMVHTIHEIESRYLAK